MTIAYPLSLPLSGKKIRSIKLHAVDRNAATESPFTLQTQVAARDAARWEADVQLRPLSRPDAEPWLAFLISLRGRFGTFLLGDPDAKTPQAEIRGVPLLNGAATPRVRTLATKGWAAGGLALKAGDYLQVGNRLYKNLTDANADGSGLATLDVFPPVREAHAGNTPLITTDTVGLFRLVGDETSWDTDDVHVYGISFAAVEAI